MEQDIDKIINDLEMALLTDLYGHITTLVKKEDLEHLIKAYKEQNDIIKTANIAIKDLQQKLENSIPVSLVEEKIEELNKKLNNKGYGGCVINPENIMKLESQIDVLQELLEKRK